ncbi:hypothetical protein L1887_46125 [Cichorium endivia]|nr:hypothetical protein L1887_46125 [Cichorium endivia]
MIWSRSSRLFPCEYDQGAFMPVPAFVDRVVKAGYKGPWSIEVFNDSLNDTSRDTTRSHATRARAGLDRLGVTARRCEECDGPSDRDCRSDLPRPFHLAFADTGAEAAA